MERPVLAILEDAELRARERRLAASTEADRRLAAGAARASTIEAGSVATAEWMIAEARAASDARRVAALQAIRAETDAIEALGPPVDGDPAIEAAADLVVAAVLGERKG